MHLRMLRIINISIRIKIIGELIIKLDSITDYFLNKSDNLAIKLHKTDAKLNHKKGLILK